MVDIIIIIIYLFIIGLLAVVDLPKVVDLLYYIFIPIGITGIPHHHIIIYYASKKLNYVLFHNSQSIIYLNQIKTEEFRRHKTWLGSTWKQ